MTTDRRATGSDSGAPLKLSTRQLMLQCGAEFAAQASTLAGVSRIALIGSLVTEKPAPKDIDFLLTVDSTTALDALAALGRKLKGRLQARNLGADIFLCAPAHEYLGRTCSYKECHPRVSCGGMDCRSGSWLRTDFQSIVLSTELIRNPPVVLWPRVVVRSQLPEDVQEMIGNCGRLE